MLERALEGLGEGRGVIVSVSGEPGIGKSRLVAEMQLHMRDRVRFVEGRSVSYAEAFPYSDPGPFATGSASEPTRPRHGCASS